jgi:hypothetical protein
MRLITKKYEGPWLIILTFVRGSVDKMTNKADKLLNVQEVAARLGVKPGWVYRHSRDLGAFHLGKYVRFDWPTLLDNLRKFQLGNEPNDAVQARD